MGLLQYDNMPHHSMMQMAATESAIELSCCQAKHSVWKKGGFYRSALSLVSCPSQLCADSGRLQEVAS